jgi:hypothetical protein
MEEVIIRMKVIRIDLSFLCPFTGPYQWSKFLQISDLVLVIQYIYSGLT